MLVNDDGVEAAGLQCLASTLGEEHEIYVVAPDRERSGVGHAFTLDRPLRCDPCPECFEPALVRKAWRCSGTPVDCVKIALLELLPREGVEVELVVSGVNRGWNLSVDVLYSGTVSAALEAAMCGVRSIAVSIEPSGNLSFYDTAASFCLGLLSSGLVGRLPSDVTLNVNVPFRPSHELRGAIMTRLGRSHYDDRYSRRLDPSGRPYYWLEGEPVVEEEELTADVVAVRAGFVSLTPLRWDLTAVDLIELGFGSTTQPRK